MDEKQTIIRWLEIEPLCVLRLLLKKAWLILLAALIGAMAASIFAGTMVSRTYTSTATFVVTPRTGSSVYYVNTTAASDVAEIYSQLLQSMYHFARVIISSWIANASSSFSGT